MGEDSGRSQSWMLLNPLCVLGYEDFMTFASKGLKQGPCLLVHRKQESLLISDSEEFVPKVAN